MDGMVKSNAAEQDRYLKSVYEKLPTLDPNDYTSSLAKHILFEKGRFSAEQSAQPRLLDVGCGMGVQAAAFSPFCSVSVIDIANSCEAFFSENAFDIDFKPCDLNGDAFPFKDNEFEYVFSKSVIEHIENTTHFLTEIRRVLKPGGTAFVMCPAWETQWQNYYDDPTHIRPFTAIGLERASQIAGFEGIYVEEFFQLPIVWQYPAMRYLCRLVAMLPNKLKWRYDHGKRSPRKWVRFSKETMLLATLTNTK